MSSANMKKSSDINQGYPANHACMPLCSLTRVVLDELKYRCDIHIPNKGVYLRNNQKNKVTSRLTMIEVVTGK